MTVTSKWVALHEVSDYLAKGWREIQIIGGCDDAALMVSPEEPASEKVIDPRNEVEYGDALRSLLAATEPASEPAKVEPSDTDAEHEAAWREFNGKPEPVAEVGSEDCVKAKREGPWLAKVLEPVAAEMPHELRNAVAGLRLAATNYSDGSVDGMRMNIAADRLESFWRTHAAQPAKVRMTREFKMVEDAAAARTLWHLDNGQRQQFNEIADCIAAVRAQAAEAGKVRMPKVRDALDLLRHRTCNTADVATLTDAIAELDAAEGKGEGRG